MTYRLSVDSEAPTSTYPVKFRIYEGSDATGYEEESIDINVLGEANLILDDLDTIPQTLEPGAIADAVIKIKNIGTGAAKDLELTLNSSHDEIKPILAKGRVYVGDIGPGETMTAALGMSIGSGAEEKTYIVTIGAEYRDESNSDASTAFSVGFPVEGTINLDIIKKEANYERNTLRIEVANKGTTEAKSLEARLVIDNETVGIDYISSLKANKKTTFEFPLALVGSGQLVMDFIGPGIEKNQVTKDVVLSYEQPSSTDGTGIIVVLIVLVIVVYLLYRKFLRKGHHHKKE